MHIMIAAPQIGAQWGGIGTYLHQLAGGLGDKHEITIVGAAVPTGPVRRARVVSISTGGDVMITYARFQLALRRRLPELLRDHRPDLFVANHAQMPDLLVRRRPRDPPFVTVAHTTLRGQASAIRRALGGGGPMDRSEQVTLATSPALLPAELYYWHRVRNAIFVSEAVRREVREISTSRLAVTATVPNGVDLDEISQVQGFERGDPEPSGPIILYTGRMLALKGIATLLQALRHMGTDGWTMCLVGTGDIPAWKAYARSLGLPEARVRFLGSVSRRVLLALLRKADIYVLPSYYESCPFALIESMALGVPAVATSIPSISDMVVDGESALLAPPGDAGALARAIHALLEDTARARRLGARAREIAQERYAASRMCEETLHAFERVLAAA